MSLLRELSDARQVPGEPRRRWFCSAELDLIVWVNDLQEPVGFQLCYDKLTRERAITWRAGRGFDHAAVDSGDDMPTRYKGTPILVADGIFDNNRVADTFREAGAGVPEPMRTFVADALERYPND